MFKLLGGVLRYVGLASYRLGGILDAQSDDEAVNLKQLKNIQTSNNSQITVLQTEITNIGISGTSIVNDVGSFTNIDPDNAVKITTPTGDYYLPKFIYP